jgi:hypothetical protein
MLRLVRHPTSGIACFLQSKTIIINFGKKIIF